MPQMQVNPDAWKQQLVQMRRNFTTAVAEILMDASPNEEYMRITLIFLWKKCRYLVSSKSCVPSRVGDETLQVLLEVPKWYEYNIHNADVYTVCRTMFPKWMGVDIWLGVGGGQC